LADFLIAYDIKDNKRLAKFCKRLEKLAIRIEYSVFFMPNVTKEYVTEKIIELNKLLDDEDDVRVYRVIDEGIVIGNGEILSEIFVFRG